MTSEEIVESAQSALGDRIQKAEVTLGDAVLHCAPENLIAVARHVRNDLHCDYLSHISGVDYLEMDRDLRFEAVYELHSMDQNHSVRIRVGLDEEDPKVPTVSEIWRGALFPEREMFDLFGFQIEGHPNLKRLIMPEDWEGYPLLKDYPLTVEEVSFSRNPEHKSELIKDKSEMNPSPYEQ